MKIRAARSLGFTLVELLVVLTLLSLMVLAMVSAFRTVAQSQERVDNKLTQIEDYRLAVGFIRDTLGRISARRQVRGMDEKTSSYLFAGATDVVTWVGVMPARYGSGGRHFFRLGLENVEGQARLVLRFAPWEPGAAAFPDWAAADSRILADEVQALSMRYENDREEPPAWGVGWADPTQLPGRIAIDIATVAGDWPTLVIPLYKLPLTDGNNGDFSVGGGRRR